MTGVRIAPIVKKSGGTGFEVPLLARFGKPNLSGKCAGEGLKTKKDVPPLGLIIFVFDQTINNLGDIFV